MYPPPRSPCIVRFNQSITPTGVGLVILGEGLALMPMVKSSSVVSLSVH